MIYRFRFLCRSGQPGSAGAAVSSGQPLERMPERAVLDMLGQHRDRAHAARWDRALHAPRRARLPARQLRADLEALDCPAVGGQPLAQRGLGLTQLGCGRRIAGGDRRAAVGQRDYGELDAAGGSVKCLPELVTASG